MSVRDTIVGIDLGTTFSLVAYVDERGPHVVRDEQGEGRVPSVLGVTPDPASGAQRVTIGWSARNHAVENARTTVYSVKRLIGKGLTDIERELPYLAYAVVPGPRDTLQVDIDGRRYSPEEISSSILRALKERAEQHLGRPVSRAVITVPAYFDDAQRQATRTAGQAAGLDVLRIVNEPTAAALAYGIGARPAGAPADDSQPKSQGFALPQPTCPTSEAGRGAASTTQTVAVYDLGGGTFDVSLLRIEGGVFQVLSTAGDTRLGGDDFDRTIIQLVTDEVQQQFGVSIQAPATKQALRSFAEAVKVRLSEQNEATIELDLGEGRLYRRTITRDEFERTTAELVERTLALCDRTLRDAGIQATDVNQVILVGGSTRMPMIQRGVEARFGRPPYTALNPDEVVAIGAAIQASILAGQQPDMLLLDVTPLSLGIETMGGAMGKLIVRNTTIPCRATEMFTTFVDGQTAIKLNVLQGERELAKDCRTLGEFELRDIPPMPAGMPKIEVEFLLDANGILNVSARELRSEQQAGIQVIPSHGLTQEEVARITTESISHAQEDVAAHRRIDLLNQVAFDLNKTRQMLEKVGDALPAGERERIEREMQDLERFTQQTDDLDALYEALTKFGHGTRRLAELGIREALRGKGDGSGEEPP